MTRQKILVVEDDELLRMGLREFLRYNNYEVVEAIDCRTAEAHFKHARPSVALPA